MTVLLLSSLRGSTPGAESDLCWCGMGEWAASQKQGEHESWGVIVDSDLLLVVFLLTSGPEQLLRAVQIHRALLEEEGRVPGGQAAVSTVHRRS